MITETALIEKREELKSRLAAGEYKTLVDVLLERIDRLLRMISPRTISLPGWYIIMVLILTDNLIGFVVINLAGETTATHKYFQLVSQGYLTGILWKVWHSIWAIVPLFMMNKYLRGIFLFWQKDVIDATETWASIKDFEEWLQLVCNRRLHILVAIIGGLATTRVLSDSISARIGMFIGLGNAFTYVVIGFFGLAFLYLFVVVLIFSARLRHYDLNLFPADPANSKIIAELSNKLRDVVYLVAGYAFFATLTLSSLGLLRTAGIGLVFYWSLIMVTFITNQNSLSAIIRRVKRRTISQIQEKIAELQKAENLSNKDTLESINRLMDYHDRVIATRNSVLDTKAYISVFNSLFFPLFGFLIANLDKLASLLTKQP